MAGNSVLRKANKEKKDEFYTKLADIELEMRNYLDAFKGKVVFCNCDDPYESEFFKYFAANFNFLGIKKLIATCYAGSPIVYTQLDLFGNTTISVTDVNSKKAYKIEINEVNDENGDGRIDLADVEYLIKNDSNILNLLSGDGDFRSQECRKLLEEADIIVTNPPFSLFREFMSVIEEYQKDFIVIGNTNALSYKEIFRLFKEDKIRTGCTNFNRGMFFLVPQDTEKFHKEEDGQKYVRVSTSCWFTNLPVKKHNEMMTFFKKYSPENYPKYENFDAINTDKVENIPVDYDGIIGVPITFLDKFNPKQFEIIGLGIASSGLEIGVKPYTTSHKIYRKEVQKKGAVDGDLYLLDEDGHPQVPYARILIRKREV